MAFIDVHDLTKEFTLRIPRVHSLLREKKRFTALSQLSFQIGEGELVGYIGPNGAGKSTTVKILSGILTPEGGSVTVNGLIPYRQRKAHAAQIGVVFGQRSQLWWDVPISDSFRLLRDIYRIPQTAYGARLRELSQALGLEDFMNTPLRQLSLGQRMRAELCGSLLHQPRLLFLDEPTIGLDAVSKLALRDFLLGENRRHGTTILLTTHDMEDIAALCPRVMVLGRGKKLFDGAFQNLARRYDTQRQIFAAYEGPVNLALPPCCQVSREGEGYRIQYPPEELPTGRMLALIQAAGSLRELTVKPQDLDHMVAALYQELGL